MQIRTSVGGRDQAGLEQISDPPISFMGFSRVHHSPPHLRSAMKRANSTPLPPASLLVDAIIREEALIAELVAATRAGNLSQVLVVSEKIAGLRTTQEAVADTLGSPS